MNGDGFRDTLGKMRGRPLDVEGEQDPKPEESPEAQIVHHATTFADKVRSIMGNESFHPYKGESREEGARKIVGAMVKNEHT